MRHRKDTPADARLQAGTDRSGGPDACWPWTRYCLPRGYGRLGFRGKSTYAHILSFQTYNGPIPDGSQVRHKCDNPSCANPRHLELGTAKDNVWDAINRNRRPQGVFRLDGKTVRSQLRGGCNPNAALTDGQRALVREIYLSGGVSQRRLARLVGVSHMTIHRLVSS